MRYRSAHRSRRGTALVMTLVSIGALSTMSVALLAVSLAGSREQRSIKERVHAEYVAEAGLNLAMVDLAGGGTGVLGDRNNQQPLGESNYWVEREDPTGSVVQLTATGVDDHAGARIELTLRQNIDSMWSWAAFGDESTNMDSNARADSYDSTLGTYASQATNGSGSEMYAQADGAIGSNGSIVMDQNSIVWGDVTCGPDGSTNVLGNAKVSGSTAPANKPVDLPPIVVPSFTPSGTNVVAAIAVMTPGDYCFTDLLLKTGAVLTVIGPANIVVDNFTMRANAQFLVDATAGPVKIWVNDDFTMSANTRLKPLNEKPSQLEINLLSDNVIDPDTIVDLDVIDLNSNAEMFGTIYAPNAAIAVQSDFELYGAIVARSLLLDSNARVHYDEALVPERGGGTVVWERIAWRSVPYQP